MYNKSGPELRGALRVDRGIDGVAATPAVMAPAADAGSREDAEPGEHQAGGGTGPAEVLGICYGAISCRGRVGRCGLHMVCAGVKGLFIIKYLWLHHDTVV